MIPKKPVDVDKLISGAKESQATNSTRIKKFLLELPYDLWKELKMEATQKDMTLKDYLLEIIKNRQI